MDHNKGMVEVPEIPKVEALELPAKETALIVVDMQNDFAHPQGALFVPEAPKTVPAIKGLLERARQAGARVVFTQDWHREDDLEFQIWPRHAVAGTWGAEILEELKPRPEELVIQKVRYDAFYGTPLDHYLHLFGGKAPGGGGHRGQHLRPAHGGLGRFALVPGGPARRRGERPHPL